MVSMLTVCIKCRDCDCDCDVDSCCNKCSVCVDGFMAAYVKHRSILEGKSHAHKLGRVLCCGWRLDTVLVGD